MADLQTFPVAAVGGLDLVSPPQVLAQKTGAAVILNNYEALIEGGYRRINGYTQFGEIPKFIDRQDFRGMAYYKGVVVVMGEDVLHSTDGVTWNTVNKDKADKVLAEKLPDLRWLPRHGSGPVQFTKSIVGTTEVLTITDDVDGPAMLTIDGSAFSYKESDNADIKGYRYSTKYQDHVVYAGSKEKPGAIAVSDRFNPLSFTGGTGGSWSAQVNDEIVGLHTFRDYLYIFCRSSIYRVVNLESKEKVAIRPVTTKIGCVDGRSIQEIGGDILFLSDDGLRYLGATERIDDVAINLVSSLITPLVSKAAPHLGPISSVVIPSKAQYRLFFTDNTGRRQGIIGTLTPEGRFAWTTVDGMKLDGLCMTTEGEGEKVFHFGAAEYTGLKSVFYHDTGDTFDDTPIVGTWSIPPFNLGDSAVRKSLHSIDVYLEPEGTASVSLEVSFDHGDTRIIQPEPFHLEPAVEAAVWGDVKWNEFEYGAIQYLLNDIFLEGSGKWIQFTFKDNDESNSPYIIRGFDLQFTAAGRI